MAFRSQLLVVVLGVSVILRPLKFTVNPGSYRLSSIRPALFHGPRDRIINPSKLAQFISDQRAQISDF